VKLFRIVATINLEQFNEKKLQSDLHHGILIRGAQADF
jgi:hypothetical protein